MNEVAAKEFHEALDRALVADSVYDWIKSFDSEQKKAEYIRYFREFWEKGIIIANKPRCNRLTGKEFREIGAPNLIKQLAAMTCWDKESKKKRIAAYREFIEWLDTKCLGYMK
jgi:hypothetical protein